MVSVKEIYKCANCGKEFERYRCMVDRLRSFKVYCSRECGYKKSPYLRTRYHRDLMRVLGSQRKGISPKNKGQLLVAPRIEICEYCGKDFRPKDRKRNNIVKYCSNECKHNSKYILGLERSCLICKKAIRPKPSEVKDGNGKFCSKSCSGKYGVYKMPRKNTSIECLIAAELKINSIPFDAHQLVEGVSNVDFLLPNKIIIQCDGDYWHSIPKVRARDKRQDESYKTKGYRVIRFTETNIRKSPAACMEAVRALNV